MISELAIFFMVLALVGAYDQKMIGRRQSARSSLSMSSAGLSKTTAMLKKKKTKEIEELRVKVTEEGGGNIINVS